LEIETGLEIEAGSGLDRQPGRRGEALQEVSSVLRELYCGHLDCWLL